MFSHQLAQIELDAFGVLDALLDARRLAHRGENRVHAVGAAAGALQVALRRRGEVSSEPRFSSDELTMVSGVRSSCDSFVPSVCR